MDYVRFGSTGMKVSRLCLGCMTYGGGETRPWALPEDQAMPYFREALEAGINFFDTADMYSMGESERITGKALKTFARRDEVVVATKVFNPMGPKPNQRGLSRKHIMEGIDGSLQRLGMDYVDLFIIHRFDPETEIEETVEALHDVVKAGKALYIGASSMYAWQFMKMLGVQRANGFTEFVSMQNYYNLIYREEEREMMPLCWNEGVAVTPWSPLARGFLGGSGIGVTKSANATLRAQTDDVADRLLIGSGQDEAIRARLEKAAEKLGVKPAVLALAWVLSKPFVTAPIIGASKPHHLADALSALTLSLDAGAARKLEELYRPKAVVGHR